MANKDHSLDSRIDEAALKEFMENGFEKASLRKIAANANVTIGAIYTRYRTKDQLFCSLVSPLLTQIEKMFSSLREQYYHSSSAHPEDMAATIRLETETVLHLLFEQYNLALLLFCRSAGSSLEHFFDLIVQRKIEETMSFFQATGIPHPDSKILKLIIFSQFHMYFQIIKEGYELDTAKKVMDAVTRYHIGGWLSLLELPPQTKLED